MIGVKSFIIVPTGKIWEPASAKANVSLAFSNLQLKLPDCRILLAGFDEMENLQIICLTEPLAQRTGQASSLRWLPFIVMICCFFFFFCLYSKQWLVEMIQAEVRLLQNGDGQVLCKWRKASANLSFQAVAVAGTVRSGVPAVGLVPLKHAQGRKGIQAPTA